MIPRELASKIKHHLKVFPIVTITGPRQSGKTTLLKNLFAKSTYVSLEDPDNRIFAEEDPRRFLSTFKSPAIFDEIQKAPHLFSYLQTQVDTAGKVGQYILSGSQNFLLMEKVSQSLSGRVGILTLLPFSIKELNNHKISLRSTEQAMLTGFYPRIWDKKIAPSDWYPSYIQTYLERDVREIKNITDLRLFQKFIKLCAGRTGQILNLSSLANDCGLNHNTIASWISILEASYIIFLLPPYYRNFNKRLIKSPKLYFYDAGLACSLLGIEDEKQLITHPLRGALFETLIISELAKYFLNKGKKFRAYFFRDKTGHEVDCLLETEGKVKAIEIKSAQTISGDFFHNLLYWQKISKDIAKDSFIIYTGDQSQKREKANIVRWDKLENIFLVT